VEKKTVRLLSVVTSFWGIPLLLGAVAIGYFAFAAFSWIGPHHYTYSEQQRLASPDGKVEVVRVESTGTTIFDPVICNIYLVPSGTKVVDDGKLVLAEKGKSFAIMEAESFQCSSIHWEDNCHVEIVYSYSKSPVDVEEQITVSGTKYFVKVK
jgi:hypothetical protein